MWMREAIEEELRALTAAVHSEGGAASIQLGHCGGFSDRAVIGGRQLAPSRVFNTYGLSFSRSMTQADLDQVASDFVNAAQRAVAVGFDAVELHLGHGYLLSQFLSPHTNRRRDRYGGALENRLRFPLRVVSEVVKRLEGQAAVLVKMNLTDGFSGGLDVSEACEVARRLEERGVDALVLSGGFVSKTPLFMLRGEVPLAEMVAVQGPMWRKLGLWAFGRLFVQKYPYTDLFFLQEAVQVREAVAMPLVLLGGVRSSAHVEQAMEQGFDFVGMGRALLHNPALVNEMAVASGVIQSGCVPCNLCIVEMDRGGVRCVRSH